jgi:CspA family cold shock protein
MNIKSIIQRLVGIFSGCNKKSQTGTIKFFDRKKRFGFIIANKQEYFFHAAATRPRDFKALQEGVTVRFHVIKGKKGPQADRIEIV